MTQSALQKTQSNYLHTKCRKIEKLLLLASQSAFDGNEDELQRQLHLAEAQYNLAVSSIRDELMWKLTKYESLTK